MPRPPRPRRGRATARRRRAAFEVLERRDLPDASLPAFLAATGFGVAGKYAAIHADAVATDAAGDTVVAGSFRGTITFGAATSFTSANTQDAFVAKYTPVGTLIWARTFAGQATTANGTTTYAVGQGSAVGLDAAGNVFVAGSFAGTVAFGSGTVLVSPANAEAFVAKLDGAGNLLWARNATAAGGDDEANALAVDASGGVVVAGYFGSSAGLGATTLTSPAASAAFVARYDAAGNATWAIAGLGPAGANAQATGVAVDSAGNIALAGFYSGTLGFAAASGSQGYISAGSDDAFVAKLDAAGRLVWLRSFGSADYDAAGGIAVDSANDVVVVGTFTGAVDFGNPGAPAVLTAGPIFDAFALELDPTGRATWARGFVGPTGWAKGQAVAVDALGQVHVAGAFTGPVDFDPGPATTTLTSVGSTDAYVANLDAGGNFVSAVQAGQTNFNAALGLAATAGGAVAVAGDYTGSIAFGAIAVPAAGLASGFVARLQTAPTPVPAAPVLEAASTTGTANVTSARAPVFDVTTADPAATVRLLRDGVVVAQRVGTGAVTDPGPVGQGVHRYAAVQVSPAGVASLPSLSVGVTFLITPPAAPTGVALLAADDSGAIGDGVTNVRAPRLVGLAGAGLAVQVVTAAGVVVGATTAASDGTWTVRLASLADGTYALQAVAIDAAANRSLPSGAFNLTILTAAPAAPPAPGLLAADDSGAVGDGITNVRAPRLTVAAAPGLTLSLVNAVGTVLGAAGAANGVYTVSLAAGLADGTYAIRAVATDAAGNIGPAGPAFALTILATPPAPPGVPSLLAADDSGAVGDGITNVRAPRFLVPVAGAGTVTLVNAAGVALARATVAAAGVATVPVAGGLADGTYVIRAILTDVAGNASSPGPAATLVVDTVAPAAPASPTLLAADDSGAVGDGITNVRDPRVLVAAPAGLIVRIFDAPNVVIGTATTSANGIYTVPIAANLADGTYPIWAFAVDVAGNAGPASIPLTLTIDATPPAAPAAPVLLAADDSGAVGDGITNVRAPRFTVAASGGLTVALVNAANAVLGSSAAAVGGTYTIAVAAALADGTYPIRAVATDVAGNVSAASPAATLVVLAAVPAKLAAPTLLPADDSGTKGDALTAVRRPRITGTATPGAEVDWLDATGAVVATGTAAAGTGVYLLQPASALANGTYTVATRQVNVAGTAGPASAGFTLTVRATTGDYFGTSTTAVATYRTTTSTFSIFNPATGQAVTKTFGQVGDVPVSGDFDGDGIGDVAVFRPSTATFLWINSSTGTAGAFQWGIAGDVPVPGDYDGDGRADFAVFRPSNATFYVWQSATNSFAAKSWGLPGDIPVPGDYFGDGRTDYAVFRPTTATFYVADPATGATTTFQWGVAGDIPVPGDYDGDGRADFAVFRPSNDVFYQYLSNGNKFAATLWGVAGDTPVAGDYFGVGRASLAVYRASNGTFYAYDPPTRQILAKSWGQTAADRPIQPPLAANFTLGTGSGYRFSVVVPALPVPAAPSAPVPAPPVDPGVPASAVVTPRSRTAAVDRALADLSLERWRPAR